MHLTTALVLFSFFFSSIDGFVSRNFPRTGATNSLSKFVKQNELGQPPATYGQTLNNRQSIIVKDLLGLGPAEIAIALVVGLVLFGPETLKSLSKDVGKAAAELKEIPKTFKEGMEEGSESVQIDKMKAIAAEKRKKRDAKLAAAKDEEDEEDDDDE
mmetsp:Transcript_19757/g.19869  ORF Transcript_19757/g.19869 Transcript_19757/m.19869 type:complete len:157 (-) Transcript_19757:90-560(-)